MSEESATPDLEEALRRHREALSRRDFDAVLAMYVPDAIIDGSPVVQRGPPAGSTASVQVQLASAVTWADGLIEWTTFYSDVDEARAAAERLAEERG